MSKLYFGLLGCVTLVWLSFAGLALSQSEPTPTTRPTLPAEPWSDPFVILQCESIPCIAIIHLGQYTPPGARVEIVEPVWWDSPRVCADDFRQWCVSIYPEVVPDCGERPFTFVLTSSYVSGWRHELRPGVVCAKVFLPVVKKHK